MVPYHSEGGCYWQDWEKNQLAPSEKWQSREGCNTGSATYKSCLWLFVLSTTCPSIKGRQALILIAVQNLILSHSSLIKAKDVAKKTLFINWTKADIQI